MKTQNLFKFGFVLLTVAGMVFSGCRKDNDNDEDTSRLNQTSKDQITLKAADDMGTNDVNAVLASGGGKGPLSLPCNATIDSAFVIADTITYIINYNGLNCEGTYSRTGTIEARKALTTIWGDAGAVVYIKYVNFKVTRVSDGRWAIVNGTKRYTNVSGGYIHQIGGGSVTSVIREVAGTLSATFDDNSTRSWNIARRKTYTGTQGNLFMSVVGFGSADGYSNLEDWGVTRNGDNYYASITTPVILKESCGWILCAGGGILNIPAQDIAATLSFGYDVNSQLVDVNGSVCPTHFRVDWTKGNNSGTFYVAL